MGICILIDSLGEFLGIVMVESQCMRSSRVPAGEWLVSQDARKESGSVAVR